MQWISKLGYDSSKVVLIIHADDGGASEEHDLAILECYNAGVVTSASVFAYGNTFDQFIEEVAPTLGDVGIHLECAVEIAANKERVEQTFWDQYEFFSNKLIPTHIDSHGGSAFRDKRIFEKYIRLSKEKNVLALVKHNQGFIDKVLETYDFPLMNDIFIAPRKLLMDSRLEWTKRALDDLRPGLYELIVHPCKGEDLSGFSDYWTLRHPSFLKFIRNKKFVLTTWKEISHRFFTSLA